MLPSTIRPILIAVLLGTAIPSTSVCGADPLTVAESSEFRATSRYQDVLDFCRQLAERSDRVRLSELGTSGEGRSLPLVILADPPLETAEAARLSHKTLVFAMGNIHAGEVDGKEALLMLARDLALGDGRDLLSEVIVVLAPIFNADGNERVSSEHRPEQNGPETGVGIRENAAGFDLNRDFVKLESPEVRSLVRFFNEWDPAVVIDCHTTNGSFHRYTITYEGGRCPAGDSTLIAQVRDQLLPDVGRRLEDLASYRSYYYGNFNADRTRWETVPPTPRYGTHYVGLRNRIAILCESYSYASYQDRILASRAFVQAVLDYVAENTAEIRRWIHDADARTLAAGDSPDSRFAVRFEAAPHGPRHALLGFVEETLDGRAHPTSEPRDYPLHYWGGTQPTLQLDLPRAYAWPKECTGLAEVLRLHGVRLERLTEPCELEVEVLTPTQIKRLGPYQGHDPLAVEVAMRGDRRTLESGTWVVRTGQPLGSLAAYLLEPQSADGLCTWNFVDPELALGKDYPVLRVRGDLPAQGLAVDPPARP